MDVESLYTFLVIGILIFFGVMETLAGYLYSSKRKSGDWIQEVGSFFVLSTLIKPSIVLAVIAIGHALVPAYSSFIAGWNFIALLLFYLLIDDVLQYWYHRTAHETPFLWKLHRAHHQAEEMGFFVSYRNAALYYLLMPNIWWVGIITFLGGAKAVALGLVLKQLVIIGSHSRVKWDMGMYDSRWLRPLVLFLERIIITPAFHHAHHGRSKVDGISDPNGNFGNMFSIWDQLFGTALYTHQFPSEYGLQTRTNDHWTAAYLYPAVHSSDPRSELAPHFEKPRTATLEPATVELVQGQSYLWCQCGKSTTQPFCDGSHHGSKVTPVRFTAQRSGQVRLCNCKKTMSSPFCDDSHDD